MKYQWEHWVDGVWRPLPVAELPAWLQKKKAVLFATRGIELTRKNGASRERYRMVKTDEPAR